VWKSVKRKSAAVNEEKVCPSFLWKRRELLGKRGRKKNGFLWICGKRII
jgi:hypothetical protein